MYMKRTLSFWFLGALCLSVLFASCSNDKNDGPSFTASSLNGTYSNTTGVADTLALTYSDMPLLGKNVTFNGIDEENAELTLQGIIPGAYEAKLAVSLVKKENAEEYLFEGNTTVNGTSVNYAGSIKKGKLTIDVDATLPSSTLVGTWSLPTYNPAQDSLTNPVFVYWETPVDTLKQYTALLTAYLPNLLGQNVLPQVLKNVTFQADGNIVASYSTDSVAIDGSGLLPAERTWVESPKNLCFWYTQGETLYVIPQIEMITALIKANQGGRAVSPDIEGVMATLARWSTTGIPLHLIQQAPYVRMYIDYEEIEPFTTLLPLITPKLPELIEQLTAGMDEAEAANLMAIINPLINSVTKVLEYTSLLEVGLNLSSEPLAH